MKVFDMFEMVHTVPDWYDGPRRGIADFQGRPHLFESEWQDGEDVHANTYLLMPIDEETFALALEDWVIWLRWEVAFKQGKTSRNTHPLLPEDEHRHREVEQLLNVPLVIDPARATRKKAEFRARHDPDKGVHALEVCWKDA